MGRLIFQDEEHDHGHHSHDVAPREHIDNLSVGVPKRKVPNHIIITKLSH